MKRTKQIESFIRDKVKLSYDFYLINFVENLLKKQVLGFFALDREGNKRELDLPLEVCKPLRESFEEILKIYKKEVIKGIKELENM